MRPGEYKIWGVLIALVMVLALFLALLPYRVTIEKSGRVSIKTFIARAAVPSYQNFEEGKAEGATSVNVTKPSGTSEGDLLIACLSSDEGPDNHGLAGFTPIYIDEYEGSGKQVFSIWYKIATASETDNYTFNSTSPEDLYAWVMRITGAHQSTPIHAQNITYGDTDNVTCPAVTTTVDDCLIIRAWGADHNDITEDSGWVSDTNITVDSSSGSSASCSGGSAWKDLPTAGDSLAEICTLVQGKNEEFVGVTIAIQPPPCSPNISNNETAYDFGSVNESGTYSTGLTAFNVTNSSGSLINISIQGTDMTGGTTWTLSDSASPGTNIYGLKAGLIGESYNITVNKTAPGNLVEYMADNTSQLWGLELYAPTTFTDGFEKTGTVTLTASCP